jgi:exodeoxyribonuclease-3
MGFSVDSLIVSVLNKEPDNYTWWTVRVPTASQVIRWRIDYCLVRGLERKNKETLILPEAKHSDHCPVLVEIE